MSEPRVCSGVREKVKNILAPFAKKRRITRRSLQNRNPSEPVEKATKKYLRAPRQCLREVRKDPQFGETDLVKNKSAGAQSAGARLDFQRAGTIIPSSNPINRTCNVRGSRQCGDDSNAPEPSTSKLHGTSSAAHGCNTADRPPRY